MKRFAFLPLAALVVSLAACTETPTALGPDGVAFSLDVPTGNGPVYVFGSYTLVLQGGVGAGVNAHPRAGYREGGTCRMSNGNINTGNTSQNTTWFNGPGQWTNAPFCRGTGAGATITCTTAGIPATYAFGGAGKPGTDPQTASNEVLNFVAQEGAWVHYQHNSIATEALGSLDNLAFTCSDNSVAGGSITLALSLYAGAGNAFRYVSEDARKLKLVTATNTIHGPVGLTLAWDYRSRVGEE
jgi:hypothetical protein